MNDRTMIGWAALVIVSVIALAAIFDKPSTARLDVKLALGVLWITNVGREPLTITQVIANNRPECPMKKGFWSSDLDRRTSGATTLKVGERETYISGNQNCAHLVRVEISTNAGTFEFTLE